LLYAKIGIPHCPICGREISKLSTDEIVDRILDMTSPHPNPLLKKEREKDGSASHAVLIEILSPIVRERKGEYLALLDDMWKRGFSQGFVDGKLYRLEDFKDIKLARYKKHSIDIVVDRIVVDDKNLSRIFEAVEKALKMSEGLVKVKSNLAYLPTGQAGQQAGKTKSNDFVEQVFNQKLSCPIFHPVKSAKGGPASQEFNGASDIEFPELEPRLFSFNSPYGACGACEGLGFKKEIDIERVMPDKNKTIAEGGLAPWNFKKNNYYGGVILSVARYFNIPDNVRLRDLPKKKLDMLLYGTADMESMVSEEAAEEIPITIRAKTGTNWKFYMQWQGVVGFLQDRYFKTESDAVREGIEKYMSQKPCSTCKGARYKSEVLLVTVGNKNIYEISVLSIRECVNFFQNLKITHREELIAGRILKEIIARLVFLNNVGLDYLTLHRAAYSLSGGESQRIRLASQIGSQLVGVLYILDEPSIGLHARDNAKLTETLKQLQKIGNTLIVIEHDEEMIRSADWLVDIGPGAGKHGGEIVAEGPPEEVINNPKSLTGKYLRRELQIEIPKFRRNVNKEKRIVVRGAGENNLKNIVAEFPLKVFTCVTGVSGSGKSTLVEETLYKALANKLHRSLDVPGRHKEIIGTENIDKVIMIDQSPIGRTPRSNPATYTGLFTPIRELFAQTKDAKMRGYSPGRFSFNIAGGRCDNCNGEGFLKIEMQFMPDVYLPCDVCSGKRYNSETLQVRYKGKNISEVLKMTVSEGAEFFEAFPKIHEPLAVLEEVGLGYIELGQSATTLSGGEAQRIKLAAELSRRATGDTLYILDEPTTGLHFDDIKKLLNVLNRLVDAGNTVVVIEHNMDVIKTADWIIDMGPEGGDNGGRIIVTGPPEEIIKYHKESYTAKYLRDVLRKQ